MRKSLYLPYFFAVIPATILAEPITESQALEKARTFLQTKNQNPAAKRIAGSSTQLTLAAACEDYFAINIGENQGMVFVASNDNTLTDNNSILGYTDSGEYDESKMPQALCQWLNEISESERIKADNSIITQNRVFSSSVSPLLGEINYAQGEPYNTLCPQVNGESTLAGCVAVAMAGIMKYHQWPITGQSSTSYTWNGKTLSCDFANTTFNWDLIAPQYNYGSQSQDQVNELGKLTYACGVACKMTYGVNASSAVDKTAINALSSYFRYDSSIQMLMRDYMDDDTWVGYLKNELDNKRPVYYRGKDLSGGHAFVCDGYNQDGYFHFNWGWGGYGNGYFLINDMGCDYKVTDDIISTEGYAATQYMATGIRPYDENNEELAQTPMLYLSDAITSTSSSVSKGSSIQVSAKVYNGGITSGTFNIGACITDQQGNRKFTTLSTAAYLGTSSSKTVSGNITLPSELSEGSYRIEMWGVRQSQKDTVYIRPYYTKAPYLLLELEGETAAISTPATTAELEITAPVTTSQLYCNAPAQFNIPIKNTSKENKFSSYIFIYLSNESGTQTNIVKRQVTLKPLEELTYCIYSTLPASISAGKYTIRVAYDQNNTLSTSYQKVAEGEYNNISATVQAATAGTAEFTLNQALSYTQPDPGFINMNVDFTNTGIRYFGLIYGNLFSSQKQYIENFFSSKRLIENGEQTILDIENYISLPDGDYFIQFTTDSGNIFKSGNALPISFIGIKDYDLSLKSIEGTLNVSTQESPTYTLNIKNTGKKDIEDAKVIFSNGNNTLFQTELGSIAAGLTKQISVQGAFEWFNAGVNTLKAQISSTSDQYEANNTIQLENIIRAQDTDICENVMQTASVSILDGRIIISNPSSAPVIIYTSNGIKVSETREKSLSTELNAGIYIVVIDNKTYKVSVK